MKLRSWMCRVLSTERFHLVPSFQPATMEMSSTTSASEGINASEASPTLNQQDESAAADDSSSKPSSVDQKILADLGVLKEKLDKCDHYLRPGGAMFRERIAKTDDLLETIGFLEACSPRMVELVEAAAQGAVGEAVLMECLQINDRLAKCLTDIEAVTLVENDQEDFFSAAATAQPSTS